MKNLLTALLMACVLAGTAAAQTVYDPPSAYTSHYRLRMWDEGDRPGADSVNQNLIDIDYQLYQVNLKADRVYTEGHTYTGANSFTSNTNSFNASEYKLSGANINTAGTLNNVAYLSANNVFLGHQEFADHFTITADDATSYINFTGTDNCLLKFNGTAFLTWTGVKLTIPGIISAPGYESTGAADSYFNFKSTERALLKFNDSIFASWDGGQLTISGTIDATGWSTDGVTTYMTSAFGTPTASGLYLANTFGGATGTQLDYVTVTINGVSRRLLIKPE